MAASPPTGRFDRDTARGVRHIPRCEPVVRRGLTDAQRVFFARWRREFSPRLGVSFVSHGDGYGDRPDLAVRPLENRPIERPNVPIRPSRRKCPPLG